MHALLNKLTKMPRYRLVVGLVFLLGLGGTISSLFAQYVLGMNPCVMCIQQRIGLVFIAILALPCLLLPLAKRWAKTAAAVILSAPAVFGSYIAVKQIYIQSLPMNEQPDCGAPWTFRLRDAPLFDLYEPLIRGTGVCGEVYQVFGISLPTWSAMFFAIVLIVLWAMYFKRK